MASLVVGVDRVAGRREDPAQFVVPAGVISQPVDQGDPGLRIRGGPGPAGQSESVGGLERGLGLRRAARSLVVGAGGIRPVNVASPGGLQPIESDRTRPNPIENPIESRLNPTESGPAFLLRVGPADGPAYSGPRYGEAEIRLWL